MEVSPRIHVYEMQQELRVFLRQIERRGGFGMVPMLLPTPIAKRQALNRQGLLVNQEQMNTTTQHPICLSSVCFSWQLRLAGRLSLADTVFEWATGNDFLEDERATWLSSALSLAKVGQSRTLF